MWVYSAVHEPLFPQFKIFRSRLRHQSTCPRFHLSTSLTSHPPLHWVHFCLRALSTAGRFFDFVSSRGIFVSLMGLRAMVILFSGLLAGAWCQDDGKMSCRSAKQGYQVCSRTSVEAVEGGSVTLPCTFSYPAHLQPSRVAVSWRSDMFRDSTVFQSTDGFVRESLKGRLSQKGDLDKRDASIFIRDIRIDDFKVYVCQVMVFDDKAGYEFHVSDRIELKLGIRCKSQGELSCRSTRLGYQVCAQTSVEAVEGGSAMLPCTFSYPAHLPPSRVSVSWRPEGFHEAIMFQSADPFLRENVLGDGGGGRFSLAGNLSTRNASISIRDLRLDDFKAYVCQLVMYYVNKENVFQVSDPIKLKLKEHTEIPATPETTTTAATSSAATSSAAPSPAATAQSPRVPRAPIHSVATAAAVLGWAALLVLALTWGRRAACAKRRRARDPATYAEYEVECAKSDVEGVYSDYEEHCNNIYDRLEEAQDATFVTTAGGDERGVE
ncbi:uncharacterized protein LOC144737618 isoform X2 [Lampetra planeri]